VKVVESEVAARDVFKRASCQALKLSNARAVSAHSDGDTATR